MLMFSIQLLVVLLSQLFLLHYSDSFRANPTPACGAEEHGLSLEDCVLLQQGSVQPVRRVKRGLLQIVFFLQALSRG